MALQLGVRETEEEGVAVLQPDPGRRSAGVGRTHTGEEEGLFPNLLYTVYYY